VEIPYLGPVSSSATRESNAADKLENLLVAAVLKLGLGEGEICLPPGRILFDCPPESDFGGAQVGLGLSGPSSGDGEAVQLGVNHPEVVVA
jgi:hypothetical protein